MLAEFVVVQQPHHTVVLVFGYRDGGRAGQEPVGPAGLLGDPGQFGWVQPVQDVRDGGARGVRVGGEGGQGLDAAVLLVAFQETGRAVVVGIGVVDDPDRGPARRGGDDGRLIEPGELGAGPGEVVGVGAEEGQVLGEAEDAAIELVVAFLLVSPGKQLAAGDESVGGRVQLVGGEVGQARVVVDAACDVVRGPARACVSAWSSSRCWTAGPSTRCAVSCAHRWGQRASIAQLARLPSSSDQSFENADTASQPSSGSG
ncbi:hypothetical protein [Streptomyces lydicus]|uniref:hypothetical protein n=1 Tax=Streptomyces lydicus TaxID=47763 RepID=UPI0036EEBB9E